MVHGDRMFDDALSSPATILAIHIALAVCEFVVINLLGKGSSSAGYYQISFLQSVEDSPLFNVVFRVLAPTVFLVLTASVWYAIHADAIVQNYWHVTAFYILIRWIFNLATGRAVLLRWKIQILVALLALVVSYAVSNQLLLDRSIVLPSARGLADELWVIVIGFIYLTASRVSWPSLEASNEKRRDDYLHARYKRLNRQFGDMVSRTASGRGAEAMSYAVMIYESFNRPPLYQWIETNLLFPFGAAHTLGPMQVSTPIRHVSSELVRIGVERVSAELSEALEKAKRSDPESLTIRLRREPAEGFEKPFDSDFDLAQVRFELVSFWQQSELVSTAAAKYNIRSDYPSQVRAIFEFLAVHYFADLTHGEG
jgi:hypothetical protein